MKILVVCQYYYPEQFRINDICSELVRRGNHVTVLTGQPNYPDGEIFEGYEEIRQGEEHNGVRIVRCKIRPRHTGAFNLARNYISFIYSAKRAVKRLHGDYDVIYVYALSPVFMAFPAVYYKRRKSIPLFLYCMDLWPESIRDKNEGVSQRSKLHPLYVISKLLSKRIYKNTDLIGVKCEEFVDSLNKECKVPKEKTVLIYEHAENVYLQVPESPIDDGVIDFFFLGNIGRLQNCRVFVKAILSIKNRDRIKLHFVGDGSDLNNLRNYVRDLRLNDVVLFHPRCSLEETLKYYEKADCCLLSLSDSTVAGLTPPGKLYGYLAASRPVVGSISGAAVRIINKADCGWCVSPSDIDGLTRVIQEIIDNPSVLKEKGINGRRFFLQHFTLEKHVDSLERHLSTLSAMNNNQ